MQSLSQEVSYNSSVSSLLQSRVIAGLKVCEENKQDFNRSLYCSLATGILTAGTLIATLVILPKIIIPISISAVIVLAVAVCKCIQKRKLWQQSVPFEAVFKNIQQKHYTRALDDIKRIVERQQPIDTKNPNNYRNELVKKFNDIFLCKNRTLENNFTDGWHQNFLGLLHCAAARQIRLESNFNSDAEELIRLKSMILDCGFLRTEQRNFPCELVDLENHILHGPREAAE